MFERVIDDDFILTERACAIFMRQICQGVEFIHQQSIVHLDMKVKRLKRNIFQMRVAKKAAVECETTIIISLLACLYFWTTAREHLVSDENRQSHQVDRFWPGPPLRSQQEATGPVRHAGIRRTRSGQFRSDRIRHGSLVRRNHLLRPVSTSIFCPFGPSNSCKCFIDDGRKFWKENGPIQRCNVINGLRVSGFSDASVSVLSWQFARQPIDDDAIEPLAVPPTTLTVPGRLPCYLSLTNNNNNDEACAPVSES